MNFIPYTPQLEKWSDHFTMIGERRKRKNGVILLSNEAMRGEGDVKIVSPTVQMVEQAKAKLKRKRGYGTEGGAAKKRRKVQSKKSGVQKKKKVVKAKAKKKSTHSQPNRSRGQNSCKKKGKK